jgi:hypothetical protein
MGSDQLGKNSEHGQQSTADYHPWTTYIDAREEARRRGDRRVGTEHLALALLMEEPLAELLGCDWPQAQRALEAMDREALAAVGLDAALPPLPPGLERPRAPRRPTIKAVLRDRLPMTPSAKTVLRDSSGQMRRGARHPGPGHVLAALLEREPPDPAADLFKTLGVDRAGVRKRLAALAD